ncbi:MAG: hypothetical protein AB1643_02570 [Patescibacteria group bacterium]
MEKCYFCGRGKEKENLIQADIGEDYYQLETVHKSCKTLNITVPSLIVYIGFLGGFFLMLLSAKFDSSFPLFLLIGLSMWIAIIPTLYLVEKISKYWNHRVCHLSPKPELTVEKEKGNLRLFYKRRED